MGRSRVVAHYDYLDEKGQLLFRKVRREPGWRGRSKSLEWLTFTGRDENGDLNFLDKITSDRADEWHRVIYRLPEVVAALRADVPVVICEGEKDADSVVGVTGMTATSASNPVRPRIEQAEWFTKYRTHSDLLIAVDQDVPGAKAGWTWVQNLREVGVESRRITVITPKRRRYNDATDVLEAGLGIDGFRVVDLDRLERAATQYAPSGARSHGVTGDLDPGEYPDLVFEPGIGWVNPETDYIVQADPNAQAFFREWRPTIVRR